MTYQLEKASLGCTKIQFDAKCKDALEKPVPFAAVKAPAEHPGYTQRHLCGVALRAIGALSTYRIRSRCSPGQGDLASCAGGST